VNVEKLAPSVHVLVWCGRETTVDPLRHRTHGGPHLPDGPRMVPFGTLPELSASSLALPETRNLARPRTWVSLSQSFRCKAITRSPRNASMLE
jgi:hypothetical protein